MALEWMDDFKGYGTSTANMLNGLYANMGDMQLLEDPDPLVTGTVIWNPGFSALGSEFRRVFPSGDTTTAGCAARFWFTTLPSSQVTIMNFRDSNNIGNVAITVTSTGAVRAYRNNESGTLLGTSGPAVVSNAWTHIEAKVFASETVGTVEVRVNGVAVLTLTGQDTVATGANVSFAQIAHQNNSGTGTNYYMKDYIIWNGSGSVNNNFFGTVSVVNMTPDADDGTLNWGTSSGTTGWNLINESNPNDTNFISAITPPPAAATMTMTNLPSDISSVRALMTLVRARKIDGGDGNLQVSLVSGAATDPGADRPITSAFTYWADISELDPNTGTAWTPTTANAAKIRFNRTL